VLNKLIAAGRGLIISNPSAKGGGGKTTIELLLAQALAGLGCRASLFDCDMTSPMVGAYKNMQVSSADKNLQGILSGRFQPRDIFVRRGGIDYVLGAEANNIQSADNNAAYLNPLLAAVSDVSVNYQYTFLDLSAGNYLYTRRPALISDVLLPVIPAINEQVLSNTFVQLKTIFSVYDRTGALEFFPEIILVVNKNRRTLFSAGLTAGEVSRRFEEGARVNGWYEKMERNHLLAGAVDLPYEKKLDLFLQTDAAPRKFRRPLERLAEILLGIPAPAITAQERYARLIVRDTRTESPARRSRGGGR
jgi:MinD-like ATPase involved in chromosome partitioning or flagellar assembly